MDGSVDAIFSAARAGNTYAKFLIHAAARSLVLEAREEADAFPRGFQVSDEKLEDYAFNFRCTERLCAPEPNTLQALAVLDESITAIEVTLENVRNGLTSEDT